jgi:hypothetical protein
VPPKERLGRDHERGPPIPGKGSARRGEERPIPVFELRTADRTAEHPDLVAQHGILQLELRHAATSGEQSHQAEEHEVDERSQGGRDATHQRHAPNRVLEPHRVDAVPVGGDLDG